MTTSVPQTLNYKPGRGEISTVNPLPDNKISPLSKLKAFADNNFIMAQVVQFLFERVENNVGKKEKMLVTRNFPFPTMFSEGLSFRDVKRCHYVVKG